MFVPHQRCPWARHGYHPRLLLVQPSPKTATLPDCHFNILLQPPSFAPPHGSTYVQVTRHHRCHRVKRCPKQTVWQRSHCVIMRVTHSFIQERKKEILASLSLAASTVEKHLYPPELEPATHSLSYAVFLFACPFISPKAFLRESPLYSRWHPRLPQKLTSNRRASSKFGRMCQSKFW